MNVLRLTVSVPGCGEVTVRLLHHCETFAAGSFGLGLRWWAQRGLGGWVYAWERVSPTAPETTQDFEPCLDAILGELA